MERAGDLGRATQGPLADRLALMVTARYALASQPMGGAGPDPEREWKALREMCHDVVALRRGDHGAEWLRIERERLADERQEREKRLEELFWAWAEKPEIREAICSGFLSREDKLALLREHMFKDLKEYERQRAAHPPGGPLMKRDA